MIIFRSAYCSALNNGINGTRNKLSLIVKTLFFRNRFRWLLKGFVRGPCISIVIKYTFLLFIWLVCKMNLFILLYYRNRFIREFAYSADFLLFYGFLFVFKWYLVSRNSQNRLYSGTTEVGILIECNHCVKNLSWTFSRR